MPGSVGPVTGFIYRDIGKGMSSSSALARFGKGGATMAGGGNISCQASQAGIGNGADVTEDTLFTVTLPANSLDIVGRQVFVEAYGTFAATSTTTKVIKVYFGSTVLVTFSGTTTQAGAWALMATITKTAAGQQTAMILNDTTVTGSLVRSITTASPSEADTAGIIIKVTGQVTGSSTANVSLCNCLTVCGYN
jgi:hypothetical protein